MLVRNYFKYLNIDEIILMFIEIYKYEFIIPNY